MLRGRLFYWMLIGMFLLMNRLQAQPESEITVKINQHLNPVPAAMWGIFFEDINFAADGGIYAELVKNRSFSFNDPMMGWKWIKKDAGYRLTVTARNGEAGSAVNLHVELVDSTGKVLWLKTHL